MKDEKLFTDTFKKIIIAVSIFSIMLTYALTLLTEKSDMNNYPEERGYTIQDLKELKELAEEYGY